MADIVDFIIDLTYEDLPEDARQAAKRCLLDAVGCMVGGIQYPAVADLAQSLSRKNPGSSQIVGGLATATRPWASFINSHACSYFDFDDGHRRAQGHPGGVVVPVALMLAAENDCSGRELLAAIVAGYDTAVRTALVMRQAGGPRKGSGAWSLAGGVAAAAKLCHLDRQQLRHGLGLAEYYAPQAPQDRSLASPSSMKEGMAWASHAAVSIVDLVEVGFDGMNPSLDDGGHCTDLGSNWEVCAAYFKMYACCRFSHPVLDGLRSMILEQGIDHGDIESITVTSFAKACLLNHVRPDNPVAAMYSIPFIIGCLLVRGAVRPEEMTGEALGDKRILKIADSVIVQEDPALTAQFPEKCLARVQVRLANGKTIDSEILSAQGDPDTPYSMEEMREKFLTLTAPLLGTYCDSLYAAILQMEKEDPRMVWGLCGGKQGACRTPG